MVINYITNSLRHNPDILDLICALCGYNLLEWCVRYAAQHTAFTYCVVLCLPQKAMV